MALDIGSGRSANVSSGDVPGAGTMRLSFGSGISSRERKFFTEQLALLLETGNTIVDSLKAMHRQIENPKLKDIVQALLDEINDGRNFADALATHPQMFDTTYVNLVSASEQGGYVDRVLSHMLDMEEKREELRSTLVSALTYPAFLIAFALSVVVFILVAVFPKFESLFASIHDQLPATTLILMWMSNFARANAELLVGLGCAAAVAITFWAKSGKSKAALHNLATKIPVVRDVFIEIYLIQTLRVMSLSLGNGVPIMETINACRNLTPNATFQQFIRQLSDNVADGRGLALGFSSAAFIPPIVKQMIATGEESGQLDTVCARIADYFQRELARRLAIFAKVIEPFMLLVMGLLVGVIVSSLILPIFKLSRATY